jgi:hypothetical protein
MRDAGLSVCGRQDGCGRLRGLPSCPIGGARWMTDGLGGGARRGRKPGICAAWVGSRVQGKVSYAVGMDDAVRAAPRGEIVWIVFTVPSNASLQQQQAGSSCSAPLLAAFTSGATAVHARRCAHCSLAHRRSCRLELPRLRYSSTLELTHTISRSRSRCLLLLPPSQKPPHPAPSVAPTPRFFEPASSLRTQPLHLCSRSCLNTRIVVKGWHPPTSNSSPLHL